MRARLVRSFVAATLLAACDAGFSPTAALTGSWISPTMIPGTYTVLSLTASDTLVTGNGTQFIEAGLPAPFSVSGSLTGISVRLVFTFGPSDTAVYLAQLVTAERLVGTTTRAGQPPLTQVFDKQ